MTDYADLKVDPELRDVLEEAAIEQYGQEFRAISRAGHEAIIAWLILRADDDIVDAVLEDHGIDGISGLVDGLQRGRFEGDDRFDPLAAVRTPAQMPNADDVGGWPRGIYLVADTPPTAYPLSVEDGTGDSTLLEETLAEHGYRIVAAPDAQGGGSDD